MKKVKNTTNNKAGQRYSIICLIVLIVVVLEIFVFNFRFFTTLGYTPVPLENVKLDSSISITGDSTFRFNSDYGKIYFIDIDTKVKNIYFDVENTMTLPINPTDDNIKSYETSKLIKIGINIDDEGASNGIDMPERSIVSTVERTKYIPLNLKGESHNLTIEFKNVKDKEFKVNGITLNKPVPFHFSIIRVLFVLLAIGLIYIIRPNSKFYKYRLNFKRGKQKILLTSVVLVEIAIMLTASHINTFYVHNTVSWQSQYNELTDAILDGHYYLNISADPKLASLENPYDPGERSSAGASSSWDHAYYEGKYYVYFGIVPALLFNIPAKLIADIDIKPFNCILILIPIFVIMSYFLIYSLAKRFISKNNEGIPLLLYIMLTTIFVSGSGTAFLMVWPDMYTLPIFTAVTLGVSGLYCWISAFKTTDNGYKLSKPKLFIGSLLMALIAGCRPQLLLALFIAVPLFWNCVFKDRKLFSKSSIFESVLFLLPIILFACFMFHYNYARFGSIFDFGANYNLTTNDMTSRGIKLPRIFQGLFYYVLQPLNVEGVFPYLTTANFNTQFMGINTCEGSYGGILFLQPILWILLLIPKVKDNLKEKGLYIITILLTAFSIIIASADAVMAGILSRYYTDFSWLILLAGIITAFALYSKYKNRDYIKIFNYCIPLCFVISLLITFAITVGGKYYSPADNNPEVYWKIATLIQFWS